MDKKESLGSPLTRRAFLGAGSLAAAGVLIGASCENNGGKYVSVGAPTTRPAANNAAPNSAAASSDHSASTRPASAGRPTPSGDLTSV